MPKRPVRQYTLFPDHDREPTLFEMIVRVAGLMAIILFLTLYFLSR